MLTFLKILLAVVVVGVLVLFAGFFWLKRKFGGAILTAIKHQKVCPPFVARELLVPIGPEDEPESLDDTASREQWASLMESGFLPLTELRGEHIAWLRVARHAETHIVAALHVADDGASFVEYYLLTDVPFGYVVTGNPRGRSVTLPRLEVMHRSGVRPIDAIEYLKNVADSRRVLDAQSFITFYERVFAMRADAGLSRPPELADLRTYAATLPDAPTLTDSEWDAALAAAQLSWRAALDIAIKDNGRRQLNYSETQWQRLESRVVVLHRALDADAVIALHGGQDMLNRLGEQLKRQSLSPWQIFDEINRRRDAAARLVLLARVQSPTEGALYAPKTVVDAFTGNNDVAEVLG